MVAGRDRREYFLSNSNLISHQVRLQLAPSEAVGTGLIFYKFLADRPAAYGPEVTSRDVAVELDWYLDWKVNKNFTLSFVGAFAKSGAARRAGQRPDEELRVRHGLRGLQLLTRRYG